MTPLFFLSVLLLQDPPKPPPDKPRTVPDEDEAAFVKEYIYDPDRAKSEIKVGDFYMRKGSFTAAVKRFEEAAKWQPNSALAYFKLGQALEKKDDPFRAAQAYRKFLELAPNDKQAKAIHKLVEKLEKEAEK